MNLIYPGTDKVAERRRFILDPKSKFQKFREISDEDIVLLLGHRSPGERYKSVHPPLDEMNLPEDPIKDLIEPSQGAKEGDRFGYLQITDSMYFSPLVPWFRGRMYHSRYRGIDTIVYAGRELLEARERELEKYAKEIIETELFDPARTAIRGITVHGSSLRLDENGLMFDGRQ
ncbi:MAG: coenzyme-B sulfoethylthiotransferase subunit gamma, partial [Halobacteriota archaeon]|nr:coenzyme-B sulfoethylthiotransferase subunit gamma [Halobacteriota archaeon]